jgi:ABC-type uncharacterized transport system permease subunit
MYAITGAKLIDWSLNDAWILAILVPLSLLISTFVLWYLIGTTAKNDS